MKFHKNKFLTTVAAAALALAVGACSSNGDDDEISMLQTDLDAATAKAAGLQEDLDEANTALMTAQADLMTANGMVTDLQGQLETANGMVTALETLIGEEMDPAADSLRGMLSQANIDLADARTALEMALDNSADEMEIARLTTAVTNAETMRDNYQTMLTAANLELEGDADNEGLRAKVTRLEDDLRVANARIAQIEEEAREVLAANAAKAASDKAAEVLDALEMLSGTVPTIEVSASSSGDLKATAATYTMSGTPEPISGIRGAILTKDRAEARVYTNIEDAVATPIGDIYQASSAPGKPKTYSVNDAGAGNTIAWAVVKRADAVVTVTGIGADQVSTFSGTVSGVAGTFTCLEAACTAPTRNTNGSVDSDTDAGTWTFAPTDPNGRIDVADKVGYLQFGWWLNQKGKDVDDGFDVQTFTDAPGMTASGALQGDTVEGSATYTGGAAGKWAIASTTEDSTEGGHFTATATLGVDFDADGDNDATNGNNKEGVSVSGSITNFMTGETNRPNWMVTLTYDGNTGVDGVNPGDSLMPTITGASATTAWSTGGAVDGEGTWEASFYGEEDETSHPTAVEGTFNAAIAGGSVGRIQGAFGATK